MEDSANRRMQRLAYSFPCLRGICGGLMPWDANELDRWAAGPISHGEAVTARFLLAVWDPNHEWTSGRFDFMDSLRVWDHTHRAAFLSWAKDPWWP